MAPTRPTPKPLKSALKKKPTTSSPTPQPVKTPPTTRSPSSSSPALFPSTKRDKRHIKHAALLSKITKPASSQKSKKRRRRPHNNQKLITSLDSLAAALPSNDGEDGPEQQRGGTAGTAARDQFNVIRRKSIKSRPGAMKRREKLDRGERERFAKNMAQMVVAGPSELPSSSTTTGVVGAEAGSGDVDHQTHGAAAATATTTTSHRWAALRGFIAQTLEQKPELKTNVQS